MARRELPRAADLLQRLRANTGDHPVVAHDLAYVHLLQGAFETCRETVEPWLDPGRDSKLPPEQTQALQLLWLRAMHRLQRLDEAMQWARDQALAATLQPAALGAASLIALDLEDFAGARDFADAALAAQPRQVEALVARGSVALATGDTAQAKRLLQQALECNPDDGRTWSALGMASLQAQDLAGAQAQLERAVAGMPGHIGSWHALGWARLLQGKRADAQAAFRAALELDRNFAETHGALGLVLALAGDEAASRHHLEVADRLDAANLTGRYARALLAGEASDRAGLEKLARRLLDRRGFFAGVLSDTVLHHASRRD
jgi:Flp pilus assembly protein TadD